MIEIGSILKRELRSLFEHYESFATEYERVLKK
jgi:hypothetical protein